MSFVRENGPKWSKLSKICRDRTDHNVKNRFFSLIGRHFEMPILKIKRTFNYLDQKILEEVQNNLDK